MEKNLVNNFCSKYIFIYISYTYDLVSFYNKIYAVSIQNYLIALLNNFSKIYINNGNIYPCTYKVDEKL